MTCRWPALLLLLSLALVGADCSTEMKVRAYEGSGRAEWQQTDRVIAALALTSGDDVADIGSGSGWFTRPLARAVAPDGRVFAVDVDPDMHAHLAATLETEGIDNVELILAEGDDPGLPERGVDLIFISNTFHHLPDPASYFRRAKAALSQRGRVAVIEYDPGRSGWFARFFGHSTRTDAVTAAMQEAGFRVAAQHDFLDRQSFLVFTPE